MFVAEAEDGSLLDRVEAQVGHVPNYARPFTHRPDVFAAWLQLNGAIKESMGLRRYELATVAAARRLRSSYCSLAHGRTLVEQFDGADAVAAILRDHRAAGLDEVDVAVIDFAEKIVVDATSVTQEDVDRLRGLGLGDDEIVSVVLAAAARCFFSKTLDALGVLPDASYRDDEREWREAAVVGRPIADS